MEEFPTDDGIAVQWSFAADEAPECVAGLVLECSYEDRPHMFLLHRTLDTTESLGDGVGLVVLELLPLGLQSVAAVAERVPDDPGHLGQAGLGLLPQCGHDCLSPDSLTKPRPDNKHLLSS